MHTIDSKTRKKKSPNLLLFNGFKYLDNTLLIVNAMKPLKNLTIFSSPNFPHYLIIILFPATSS